MWSSFYLFIYPLCYSNKSLHFLLWNEMKWKKNERKCTLYRQNYSLTHPNIWNQVFQSLPWPQVYKSKYLGMQTVSTNICERMGHSQELSEFQCGSVIGCHLCNKSSCEMSSLLNIPQSAVSDIITKWRRFRTTATQPQSGGPHKMMERGQRMLRRIVHRGRQLSAVSRYRPPNFMWHSD